MKLISNKKKKDTIAKYVGYGSKKRRGVSFISVPYGAFWSMALFGNRRVAGVPIDFNDFMVFMPLIIGTALPLSLYAYYSHQYKKAKQYMIKLDMDRER